ncbi:hormone-sensitive lipase [Haematobia irritans]|uniref:hormone-sensitive lipase n=1 Tax=Haematobia irritans TaxID=7368 RepID=UPI003F4FFA97
MSNMQCLQDVENGSQSLSECNKITAMTASVAEKQESGCNTKVVAEMPSCSAQPNPQIPHTPDEMREKYRELLLVCQEHALHFKEDNTEKGQRLQGALVVWQDFIIMADSLTREIEEFASRYDFDANTPGNGYRSFISVVDSCIEYGLSICKNLTSSRSTLFFRKKSYMKDVEACSQLLSSLCTCMKYLLILHEWSMNSEDYDLFANGDHSAEDLFEKGDTINQYSFYGRCLGFQYGDSIRSVLKILSISMAGFSEAFYAHDFDGPLLKTTRSVWTSGKYLLNPELRARRIVNLSQNAKIDFCKSFWFLAESELMQKIPSIVGTSIKVNQVIEIPSEPLQLPKVYANDPDREELLDIPVPSSHMGPGLVIQARLLSSHRREGMIGLGPTRFSGWRKLPPRTSAIVFHCHGGGFVAQSSKSHESYLRDWAVALDCPILSIDYSLAPEAPFPRAIEEVFYAYCWMLKNASHLGTKAERVILAGDSAGANLCIALTLKCIEQKIRIPDGLFLAYCPTLINFVPSPARLLCLMDPLLPFGFMMRCLRAYAAPSPEVLIENSKNDEILKEIRKASEEEPHYKLSLEKTSGCNSPSKRGSSLKSSDKSKWEEIKSNKADASTQFGIELADEETEDSSENTFASASYHSQTIERTDLPVEDDDNSSCVSFEDDSQPIEHYPVTTNKNSDAEQYIDRFLETYIVESPTEEAKEVSEETIELETVPAKTLSEENLLIDVSKDVLDLDLTGKFNNAVNSINGIIHRYTQSYEIKRDGHPHGPMEDLQKMDALIARSPSAEFAFQIPRDPLLSPYFACDEWLKQMPPTKILSLEMDPCLDDCVMFAKKLKKLNRPVSLDILKGLPHGFLNFTLLSNEAMEGSKTCINLLKQLISEENQSNTPSNEA